MVKVLHIVGVMNRAGLETFIMNMFRSINKDNFSFDFLCLKKQKGDYDAEIYDLGGEIRYVEFRQSGGVTRHLHNYSDLKNFLTSYNDVYDIIHIHNYHAFDSYVIARAARDAQCKKIIVHSHSTSAEFHKVLHYIFRPLLKRLTIEKLACSIEAGEWLFGENNVKVISNGIHASNFRFNSEVREIYRKTLGFDNCFVIGHVGRFEYVKNQIYLCKILPEIQKKYLM